MSWRLAARTPVSKARVSKSVGFDQSSIFREAANGKFSKMSLLVSMALLFAPTIFSVYMRLHDLRSQVWTKIRHLLF